MFVRYSLRTVEVEAARAFYHEVAGLDFSEPAATAGVEAWPLHEQARARGAPPHWLGQLGVADVEAAVGRLLERGATRLGPTVEAHKGSAYATLRDPFGAVVAVRDNTAAPERAAVAWHQLHVSDMEGAWSLYAGLCGWADTGTVEMAGVEGGIRTFGRELPGSAVGGVANTARLPGVHPHWLFCFPVADLDASLALVRAKGGTPLAPMTLPNGDRVAGCDDPQGAAFGLYAKG